jgi:hypothetical protein
MITRFVLKTCRRKIIRNGLAHYGAATAIVSAENSNALRRSGDPYNTVTSLADTKNAISVFAASTKCPSIISKRCKSGSARDALEKFGIHLWTAYRTAPYLQRRQTLGAGASDQATIYRECKPG